MKKNIFIFFFAVFSGFIFANNFEFVNTNHPVHDNVCITNTTENAIVLQISGITEDGTKQKITDHYCYNNSTTWIWSEYVDKLDKFTKIIFHANVDFSVSDFHTDHNDLYLTIDSAEADINCKNDFYQFEKNKRDHCITYKHQITNENFNFETLINQIKTSCSNIINVLEYNKDSNSIKFTISKTFVGIPFNFVAVISINENEITLTVDKIRQSLMFIEPNNIHLVNISKIESIILENIH